MIRYISKGIMPFSPEILLSPTSRDRCIANIKQLPKFLRDGNDENIKHRASVLLPLCVHNGDLSLLYTLRSLNLNSHSGQVSFPGGKMDGDETAYDTALRETEEEIGVPATDVTIWTEMSEVQGRDKSVVITPVIGIINNFNMKKLQPSVHEVAEIFTVPLRVLCDPSNHAHMVYDAIATPVFVCGKHRVWGITGFITHIFLQSLLSPDVYNVDFTRKKYELDELMPSKL